MNKNNCRGVQRWYIVIWTTIPVLGPWLDPRAYGLHLKGVFVENEGVMMYNSGLRPSRPKYEESSDKKTQPRSHANLTPSMNMNTNSLFKLKSIQIEGSNLKIKQERVLIQIHQSPFANMVLDLQSNSKIVTKPHWFNSSPSIWFAMTQIRWFKFDSKLKCEIDEKLWMFRRVIDKLSLKHLPNWCWLYR